jgi:hypothetical protein
VRRATRVTLSSEEWVRLRDWAADARTPVRVRLRAEILLARARGESIRTIGRSLRIDPATVALWVHRFETHRLEGGLRDSPRPGRLGSQNSRLTERILHATYHVPPPRGLRWTTRSLGRYLGVNHMVVHRVWRSRGVAYAGATGGTEKLPLPRPNACVDLLGAVFQSRTRAAVFGIQSTAVPHLLRYPVAEIPVSESVSGAYLVRPDSRDLDELVALLDGVRPVAREGEEPIAEVRDLLILLRELEEATAPTTHIHVITERWPAGQEDRLKKWLEGRPRFFLQTVGDRESWSARVRTFVSQWDPTSLRRGSFGAVPSFALARIRFAGEPEPGARGLVWRVPQGAPPEESLPPRGVGSPTETADPAYL